MKIIRTSNFQIHKVLLTHGHTHLFLYCPWQSWGRAEQLRQRGKAHQGKDIYRKILSTPTLEFHW